MVMKTLFTVITALFMIPTAVVFPALLRRANTPPPSVTLKSRTVTRWSKRGEERSKSAGYQDEDGDLLKGDKSDFSQVFNAGESDFNGLCSS